MKRYIRTAVEIDENLSDSIDQLEADFDYITSGLENLGRSGPTASKEASIIVEALQSSLKEVIARIGEAVSSGTEAGE